jgi:hypothetical protein
MFPTMSAEYTVIDGRSNLPDPGTISLPPGPPGQLRIVARARSPVAFLTTCDVP